jgi:hypothetical protein
MFKKLIVAAGLLTLAGAAAAQAQVYYNTQGYAAPVYAAPPATYATAPTVVYQQPVYAQPTYVAPAPVYVEPAYYPGYYGYPGISLGFGYYGGGHHWH